MRCTLAKESKILNSNVKSQFWTEKPSPRLHTAKQIHFRNWPIASSVLSFGIIRARTVQCRCHCSKCHFHEKLKKLNSIRYQQKIQHCVRFCERKWEMNDSRPLSSGRQACWTCTHLNLSLGWMSMCHYEGTETGYVVKRRGKALLKHREERDNFRKEAYI